MWCALTSSATAAAATTTILPLGDSITFGCGDSCANGGAYDCTVNATLDCPNPLAPVRTCHGGYRTPLYRSLSTHGYAVSFVGPLHNGPTDLPVSAVGHGGYSGAEIGPNPSTGYSLADYFAYWTAYKPDIILLMVGTNDLWAGLPAATILARLRALLMRVQAALPGFQVLLSSVLSLPSVNVTAEWEACNSGLPALVSELAAGGMSISLVDAAGATHMCPTWPNELCCATFDVHPSSAGYGRLAGVLFDALVALLPPPAR